LPHKFRCMQPGISWEPDMDTPQMLFGKKDEVVLNCQEKCRLMFGCKHFSVIFPNTCRFAGSGARSVPSVLQSMSGPDVPECSEAGSDSDMAHTFMRKFGDNEGEHEETAPPAPSQSLLPMMLSAGAVVVAVVSFAATRAGRVYRDLPRRAINHALLVDLEADSLME
jgi:hypothetical protein